MAERIEADVCIVGAGYAGLTAARRLQPGGKTVVVARGARPRRRPDLDAPSVRRLARRSRRRVARARSTTRSSGSRARSASPLTRRGSRARTSSSAAGAPAATPASSRRSAPSRSSPSRCAQLQHRPDGEAGPAGRAVDRAACRGVGPRSVAWWLERVRHPHHLARDLFEMAVRGPHDGRPERDVVAPPAVPRPRARQHQHVVLDREAARRRTWSTAVPASIAQRVADELDDAVRLNAPVRSITQGDDHVVVERRRHGVGAGTPSSRCRPRSRWRSRSIPCCPTTATTLYRNAIAGPETKTLVVYDEPFWRADGFSGQTAEPRLGRRGDARRDTGVGERPA